MKGGGLALLWLLVPSLASAAPVRRDSARVCSAHTITLRKLARIARSFSGPVAHRSTRPLPALFDASARLQRGSRTVATDDGAAIQNDAPAAWIDADAGPAFALEPFGVPARPRVRHSTTHDFSPRSPRGPPVAG
jgi:hypothetical protein